MPPCTWMHDLAVGDGGLGGQQPGPGCGPTASPRRAGRSSPPRRGRRRGPPPPAPACRHTGASRPGTTRWACRIAGAPWRRRRPGRRWRRPGRRGAHRRGPTRRVATGGVFGVRPPAPRRADRRRATAGSAGRATARRPRRRGWSGRPRPGLVAHHHQRAERTEVLDHHRRGRTGARRTAPTLTLPSATPSTNPAARWRSEDRARHQRPAELLEHHCGRGGAQAEAPTSSASRSENTPASASSDQPRRVDDDALALGRRGPCRAGTPRAQPAHPVGQRHLVLGQLEVHASSPWAGRGSARR